MWWKIENYSMTGFTDVQHNPYLKVEFLFGTKLSINVILLKVVQPDTEARFDFQIFCIEHNPWEPFSRIIYFWKSKERL